MCASHVRRAAVCAAEARTPRGNPKRERALFPTTRTCAFLKRGPWERRIFSRIQRPPARCAGILQSLFIISRRSRERKKKERSARRGQTIVLQETLHHLKPTRSRDAVAAPSRALPSTALTPSPSLESLFRTLPSPRSPPASPFRRAKRRRASPRPSSAAARSLPASPAHSCVAPSSYRTRRPRLSYRALRRDASDAREQTTCVSRRRRARRRPLVRRSLAEAGNAEASSILARRRRLRVRPWGVAGSVASAASAASASPPRPPSRSPRPRPVRRRGGRRRARRAPS